MKSQNGNIALHIMSALAIGAIIVLGYILWSKNASKEQKTTSEYIPQPEQIIPKYQPNKIFFDGLESPRESAKYELDDMGAGIASADVYYQDINGDGVQDRITKTRNENGTAHYWEDYKIELNQNGRWRDITPEGFRTTEGAECSLKKIQFTFEPEFKVVKISRPWRDSWTTPSMATKTVYTIQDNELVAESTQKVGEVCDVAELF